MIGKLKGTIDSYGEDFVILDVHGVGYLVHCSARTLQALPAAGEAVELAIETHVREDHIDLYGFIEAVERDWFRLLTTVQGVGARIQHQFDRKWPAGEARRGRLVVIGESGFDKDAIRALIVG